MMTKSKASIDLPQINIDDYIPCDIFLGQGSFGNVTLVTCQKTKEQFALKKINYTENDKSIEREILIMSSLHHPCLCSLSGFQIVKECNSLYILEPFLKNGSLDKIINANVQNKKVVCWDATAKMKALYGIAVGMAYMHSKGAIHRDLKPANVLLDDNYEIKITDFGTSRFFSQAESLRTLNIGTPSYMAPEVISDADYDEKVDVYSYGITMYEILHNKFAYHIKSPYKLLCLIANGSRPHMNESNFPYGHGFYDLIQKCWSPASSVRPSFQEILDLFPSILPGGIDLEKFLDYVSRVNPEASKRMPTKDIELKRCKTLITTSIHNESTFNFPEIELLEEIQNDHQQSQPKLPKQKVKEKSNSVIHNTNQYSSSLYPSKVEVIKSQAEKGNAKELYNYGLLLYCGDDEVNKDIPKAITYIKKAAEKQNIDAIYWLGVHYFEGMDGIEIDMEKARSYIKKAADNNHSLAQFFYGFISEKGSECYPPGIDQDHASSSQKKKYEWKANKKEGFTYTKMAADKGHATSALMIARKYESGVVPDKDSDFSLPKNEEMATKYYKMAADSGDVSSMIKFAKRADMGIGMNNDPNIAVRYMKLAADSNEMHGMYYYGFYLLNGKNGCKQNFKLAVDLIKKAADKGLLEARTLYGNMLRTGFECVEKNEELAKKYSPPEH